jgi:hypothetical protein
MASQKSHFTFIKKKDPIELEAQERKLTVPIQSSTFESKKFISFRRISMKSVTLLL